LRVDKTSMKAIFVAALIAAFAFCASACSEDGSSPEAKRSEPRSESASSQNVSTELPELARALILPESVDPPAKDDLIVEQCGIQPVFPCIRLYFVTEDIDLDERLALVRRRAVSAGWRIASERREGGIVLAIERGTYRGSYMLEDDDPLLCEAASRCLSGTMLTIAGPARPLPAPSVAERARWSAEKKAFIEDANAACAEMQARMGNTNDISAALTAGLKGFSSLRAPAGEEMDVDRILKNLRNLARAAAALTDDKGEDALPAAVGVGEFTKRFNSAASRYGLEVCARLG
jgi:hypothetical protein